MLARGTRLGRGSLGRILLVLATGLLLAGVIPAASPMGQAPSTCKNAYTGTITSFKVSYPGGTLDPIANPSSTISIQEKMRYNVTFTVHTDPQSTQNNTQPGTLWYDTDTPGYGDGVCYPGQVSSSIGPDQNVTIEVNGIPHPANLGPDGTQSVFYYLWSQSGVTFDVYWYSTNSTVPTNSAPPPTISTGNGSRPEYVGVNPTTDKVYVDLPLQGQIAVVDGATSAVTKVIQFNNPTGVAVNPIADRIYSKNYSSTLSHATLATIDGSSDSVVASAAVGTGDQETAVNPYTNRIYVDAGESIDVIDGATNALIANISIGTFLQGIAIDTATDTIYATSWCYHCDSVYVIDGATNTVTATIPLSTAAQDVSGWGIAADSVTHMVYVATGDSSDELYVIDGSSGGIAATIAVGQVYNVVADPLTDRIFVSESNNTVAAIDGSTNSIVARYPTGSSPWGMAFDASTNRLYVADEGGGGITVIDVSPPTSSLSVKSENQAGQAITGYTAVLNYSGVILSTGSTPNSFVLDDGVNYTVRVDGFGLCHFSHWQDTGNTTAVRSISTGTDVNVTAIFECAGLTTTTSTTSAPPTTTTRTTTSATTTTTTVSPSPSTSSIASDTSTSSPSVTASTKTTSTETSSPSESSSSPSGASLTGTSTTTASTLETPTTTPTSTHQSSGSSSRSVSSPLSNTGWFWFAGLVAMVVVAVAALALSLRRISRLRGQPPP